MNTHYDSDFTARAWFDNLRAKAGESRAAGTSVITGGREGEEPFNQWDRDGVHVRHMPDDEHGILRISVGGGDDTPIPLNYLVFRGDYDKCVRLLRKALAAMEAGPSD